MEDQIIVRDGSFPALLAQVLLEERPSVTEATLHQHDTASSSTTDTVLHCGTTGRSLRAHRVVLAAISEFLSDVLVEHSVAASEVDVNG